MSHRPNCIQWVLAALCVIPPAAAQNAEPLEFFEKRIRPLVTRTCQACHNPKLKTAQLDLSTGEGFRQGGQSGPLVTAGHPDSSLLLKVLSYDERMKMPPTGKLKPEEIADFNTWVRMGAPWPGSATPAAIAPKKSGREFTDQERQYWAFQPVVDPAPPKVGNEAWVRTPVDRFILARLEALRLTPAPSAGPAALLRRVTFDLTGLPPSEIEVREFLADRSPDRFTNVVDRLLASPRYGEKWGRHWLDVARYADSTGNDEDHRYPHAWRYRDYVIEAFNTDLPYDQFLREQIAGDLVAPAGSDAVNRRGIVATGFLALGAKAIAQQDKQRMLYDVYDEQVDVVSKAFLGLTLACARCHDHKFDPILTKDYYSLVSIFASTRSFQDAQSHVAKLLNIPLTSREEYARYQAHQDRIVRLRLEIEDLVEEQKERYNEPLAPRLAEYMLAARRVNRDNATLAAAGEHRLREDVLNKWVNYLQPGKTYRPHLDEWNHAAEERLREVARSYQDRYQERLREWTGKMANWRERARRMTPEASGPAPEKPKFEAEEDGFFFDVYIQNGGPFSLSQKDQPREFSEEARQRLAKLASELDARRKTAPPEPDMACAVEEGEIVHQKVFIRGDYGAHGEDAPKGFPLILTGPTTAAIGPGSGRLALAGWLARPDHPLTARVMVNRIWQWHFGDGIVRTPDNFGKMGERPTHPELLDWLARRFVESGWSVKAMHRIIVLSSAYRMSSQADGPAAAADAENRLFSRFPRRRLAVEEIRDAMLAIDGSLDLEMGGTMQKGAGTDSENSQNRLSVRFDQQRRRTAYLPLRRANLPTLLNLFDFGDATTAIGKRVNTNIAPQALFLLNSEFIDERSARLARMLLTSDEPSEATRADSLWLRILNRLPSEEERNQALGYVGEFGARFAGASQTDAWKSLSRALLASSDFMYVD